MHRDLVVGILGAAVLLVGLLVVFIYESSSTPAPDLAFPVTFATRDGGAVTQRGDLAQGEETSHAFELPVENATSARIVLDWTDDVGDPDLFNLTVSGPGGLTLSREGSTGSIEIDLPLTPAPAARTILGEDRASVSAAAEAQFSATAGEGAWSIVVRLVDAPGQRPVPQAPQVEIQPDGANDYELVFGYQFFVAVIGEPMAPA